MPRIPTYERRTQLSGNIQGGRVSGQSAIADAASGLSRTLERMGAQEGELQIQANRLELQKQEDRAAVDVANVLSKGDVYWQQNYDERAKAWKPGDPDMREGIGKDFDKWMDSSKAVLPTEKARNYFEKNAVSMRTRLQTSAYDFQDKATLGALVADTDVGMKSDADIVYRSPERLAEVKTRRLETVRAMTGLSEAKKIEIGKRYSQEMDYAVERGELERDPAAFLAKRRLPAAPGQPAPEPQAAPAPFDKLFSAVVGQESKGVHTTASGSLLTSPAGAKGITQVMPATGSSPGYGVAPLKDQSKEEYLRFGKDYLNAMLQEYNGDQAKALAAYNAGPGRVNDAVRKNGQNWLASMPQETKDYVSKISAKAGDGAAPAIATAAVVPGKGVAAGTSPEKSGPSTFEALPYEQREALIAAADTKLKQKNAQFETTMNRTLADATAMHVDGKQDPFNLGPQDFDRAYGADGPRRFGEYQNSRNLAADIKSFQTMPPDQIAASLVSSKAGVDALAVGGGNGYATADQRQQIRVAAAKSVVEEQQKDPQAYAIKAGLSTAKPLEFNDMQKFGNELSQRVATAKMLNQQYGAPFRLMTDPETKQLTKMLQTLPSAGKVDYLESIRQNVKDPAAYRATLAQIAPDSPVTAVAGSILGKSGDVRFGNGMWSDGSKLSPVAVATTILQGEAILNPTKDAKKQDGRSGNFPMPKDKDFERDFADYAGNAFRGDAAGYDAAFQSYRSYYAGKASEQGILSPDLDTKLSKEAVNAVTGGVLNYNSNGKVLKPWGMPDDSFKDAVKAKFNAAMTDNKYTGTALDNLDAYGLQSLSDSRYLMTNGGTYLVGRNGQPIVIDLQNTGPQVTRQSMAVPIPADPPRTPVAKK